MQLITSPWTNVFDEFVRTSNSSLLIASPFITRQPLQRLAESLAQPKAMQVKILTNLAVDSMIQGTTDPAALLDFCSAVPSTEVRHLPGLHAKVYVADSHSAIISSANLTGGGLYTNYEYGILLSEPSLVSEVANDLEGYGKLGVQIDQIDLVELASAAKDLQARHSCMVSSARGQLRREFEDKLDKAKESLLILRAKSSQSTNAIFSRTILYLLKKGSQTTEQLHPLIQQIHPDLCDDSIDRIINGVRFGKRWKHMVRNAQQSLRRHGLIRLDGEKWHLAQ